MNVACTACPAKYAVPDERVRGKRVRITCKHCGTFIVVDGTSLGSGSHVGPPPQGAAPNNVRERRQTMLGIGNPNANAAASLGVPLGGAPRGADSTSHSAWLVALNDGRREPASLARIVDLFAAGSIHASTYIWRDGMADWKKPFEIPEIASALRARGIGPGGMAKGLSLPPPDQDEATRVSFAPNEDGLQAKAQTAQTTQSARPAAASQQRPSTAPATTSSFDDESVTVARSGPPSNPMALSKPLNSPSGPPGRNRPTLPPLQPAAGRPPLPRPSEAIPARTRPNTIPPIGLAGVRRSLTPNGSAFAQAAAAAAAAPSTPPPPPPPPPPVVAPSTPPPAPSFPDASAFVAAAPSVPAAYPAPAQFPAPRQEFEVVPRSGPPVALQLDDDPFHPRRSKAAVVVVSLLVVAAAGAAGFMFLGPRATTPPAPSQVAAAPPPPTNPPPAPPPPVASETAAPAPSASAAPAPSAEKVATKTPAAPRATKRDESAAPKPVARRAASPEPSASDSDSSSESSPPPSTPETAIAEKLARADDPPPAPQGSSSDPEFNRDAAAQVLGDAASRAESCRTLGGPSGSGQATVTFSPNGRVSGASIGGEFAGTTVGACLTRLFRGVSVPAFSGPAVTVNKRFSIE